MERLTEVPSWERLMEEALTMPGSLSSIYSRFYSYSFNNQILLWMQGVTEPVATFNRWKEMGRSVKKGSKAKAILRPITIKSKDEVDDQGKPKQFTKFKLVNALFTASETEGDDLPEYVPPEWNEERALQELGITRVPFEHLDGNTQGYSYDRNVAISPVAAYPFKTLIHEIAHIVCGHTEALKNEDAKLHRGVAEFQAESTAYLVLNDLGTPEEQWDAAGSRGYIQHWLSGEKPSNPAIREVFKAVDTILRAGHVSSAQVAA